MNEIDQFFRDQYSDLERDLHDALVRFWIDMLCQGIVGVLDLEVMETRLPQILIRYHEQIEDVNRRYLEAFARRDFDWQLDLEKQLIKHKKIVCSA